MKRKELDKIAAEIYYLMTDSGEPFEQQQDCCKRFYRKIARWHLNKVKTNVP